jgi:hypothetical protein
MITGQYRTFTYMLSFVSIKGTLRFDAKTIEFKETTKIAMYITK